MLNRAPQATQLRCNPNVGILKYGRKRSAAAVCERIRAILAIVRDEPRMDMDCIAWSMMPTEPCPMPVATQNKITRACALSFVVSFSMASSRRQLWTKAREVIVGSIRLQRGLPAGFIAPCLPTKTDKLPTNDCTRLSMTGFGSLPAKKPRQARPYSRPGNDLTTAFR